MKNQKINKEIINQKDYKNLLDDFKSILQKGEIKSRRAIDNVNSQKRRKN